MTAPLIARSAHIRAPRADIVNELYILLEGEAEKTVGGELPSHMRVGADGPGRSAAHELGVGLPAQI